MPVTDAIDPKAIYERELDRLRSELGTTRDEIGKSSIQRDEIREEVDKLSKSIQGLKDQIASFEQKKKESEEAFAQSRANSIAALEKRDKESQDRIAKADEITAEAQEKSNAARQARNQVLTISEDTLVSIDKIEKEFSSSIGNARKDLQTFLALKDPKVEIPAPKKK